MKNVLMAVPFLILYLLLTGNWEVSNVVVGAALALGVTTLIRPSRRPASWQRIPGALLAAGQYLVVLLWDLVKSGVQVTVIVLSPSLPIRPGIVAIDACCMSELATALSAHAITVTPGELVVEIDDSGVMYTHVLDTNEAAEHAQRAQQMRQALLTRIFE